jgi:hypothetical protein
MSYAAVPIGIGSWLDQLLPGAFAVDAAELVASTVSPDSTPVATLKTMPTVTLPSPAAPPASTSSPTTAPWNTNPLDPSQFQLTPTNLLLTGLVVVAVVFALRRLGAQKAMGA